MSSRHIDVAVEVFFLALSLFVLPWLHALKARAEAGRRRDALAFLEGLAQVVVAEGEDTVRRLKDAGQPGEWTPEMAAQYRDRAVAFLKRLGAAELAVVAAAKGGTSPEEVARRIVEAQVELARARRPYVAAAPPAAIRPSLPSDPPTSAETPRAKLASGQPPPGDPT